MDVERVSRLDGMLVGTELVLRYNENGNGSTVHGYYCSHEFRRESILLRLGDALRIPINLPVMQGRNGTAGNVLFLRSLRQVLLENVELGYLVRDELELALPCLEDLSKTTKFYLARIL